MRRWRRLNLRRGFATLLWAAGVLWLRTLWPWATTAVQTDAWSRRWRRSTDRLCRARVQVPAASAVLASSYLLALLPDPEQAAQPLGVLVSMLAAMLAAVVMAGGAVIAAAVGRVTYRHTPRKARARYGSDGWASSERLREGVSAAAARRAAVENRPSVRSAVTGRMCGRVSERRLVGVPVPECGTPIGRTAVGPPFGIGCYAPHRDAVGGIAPPQSMKSALAGVQIVQHPGAVLCTQTKPETYRITRAAREARSSSGRVDLIDPEGLTGERSTITFAPQRGCRRPLVAQERAAVMAGSVDPPGESGEWFVERATVILRVLLMVADVAGLDMARVYAWATGGERGLEEAMAYGRAHDGEVPAGWLTAMAGIVALRSDKTKGGILAVLASCVDFMADPDTAALCLPPAGTPAFDVRRFLNDRSTVYLIASDRQYAKVGPLLAVFCSHVFEEAKRIAPELPGERLDPALQFNLDEVANTIPLPLDRWITDAGGRGVQIVWWAQSRSQLRQRWGRDGADTVWNATVVKLVSGGLTVGEDLAELSKLCGERQVDEDQQGRPVTVPRLSVDALRELPRWHALLLHRSTPATIVRITPIWVLLNRSQLGRRTRALARRLRGALFPAPSITPPTVPTLVVDGSNREQYVDVPDRWSPDPIDARSRS